jgi:hypothetical protein
MRRAFLTIALLALSAAPAAADVRLIDPATGASTTVVEQDYTRLVARFGESLVVKSARTGDAELVGPGGSRTLVPRFDHARSIGPGGHTLDSAGGGFELRAPDGRLVATLTTSSLWASFDPGIAWSADGSRVAVVADERLRVVDTATGAVLVERDGDVRLGEQAFAPDGSSLVLIDKDRASRVEIPSGTVTPLGHKAFAASWSPNGSIALTRETGIAVIGAAGVRAPINVESAAQWSIDGRTLAFSVEQQRDECSYPLAGVAVAQPGSAPRVVIPPSSRELYGFAWVADGRLAVDLGPEDTAGVRGKRHPWPKRVAGDYEMFSPGGDAAIRRVMVRVATALKRGASRDTALSRLRLGMATVQERYEETDDTAVRDAIAVEIDRWLHAAGFGPVESADDVMC